MGNGASQSLRQTSLSDSRVSALRLDGAGADGVDDVAHARAHGNHTLTLRFSLEDYADEEARKPRARSLTGTDSSPASAAAVHAAAAFTRHQLHALDEGREDHNSSAASVMAVTTKSNNSERSPRVADDESDDSYNDEPFDEETIEWKRGEALGSGSYGTVYLARDERTGALMAVKEIIVAEESEDEVRSASREVELLRSLRHANVVKYLGSRVDYDARKLHIFTEWVPGGNLEQNRKRFGGSERVVRRFTRQILQGVAYLHAKRIVHHDIKPSNLLVDQHGVVKLADFGSSRLIATSTLVNNASMRGTPNYMAPEVITQSDGPRSFKSDIWSIGCSVLRLLTGQPLWGDKHFDSQIALLYYIAHLTQLPPLPEMLSDDARSFIELCLEIDPVKRPSAEELLTHPFVGGSGGSFMLPSRSTLVALTPTVDHVAGPQRSSTAPADAHGSSSEVKTPRRELASAPAKSKSQLVSARFPSRGLFDEASAFIKKPGEAEDDEDDDRGNPETLSLSVRSKISVNSGASSQYRSSHKASEDHDDDPSEMYTFSEFAETVVTTPRHNVSRATGAAHLWEEQPILTDAARAERERQSARVAEEKRKKEDRERKFQEELLAFRRDHAR